MPTTRSVADQAILETLADGPLSANELSDRIRRQAWADWSERHGVDVAWETDHELVGARARASGEARRSGLLLASHEIYSRLRSLEKHGDVVRIQIDGHRPMLWRLP